MKRLLGFTLTELMVAITVLGVLTAAVLPAILGNNPNQNKMMMKKAYYVAAEVISDMVNDDTLYPTLGSDGTDYSREYAGNRYLGVLNNSEAADFDGINTGDYDYKFAIIFARSINPKVDYIKRTDTGASKYSYAGCDAIAPRGTDYFITPTKDGMVWCISKNIDTGLYNIMVDVNGAGKPNCYQGSSACSGRSDNFDQFRMNVYPDGAIVINDADVWAKDAITVGSSLTD